MKIKLLIIVLCFSAKRPAYALDGATLQIYFKLVHQAAVSVCKGELMKASRLYDSAFVISRYPFFEDLNNAIYVQVNSNMPDTNRIVNYLKRIQNLGICVHERYKTREKFLPFLSLIDEKNCKKVRNPNAAKKIEEILAEDQKIRDDVSDKYHDYTHPSAQAAMNKIDSLNYPIADSILKMAEKANIPLINYIGLTGNYSIGIILQHNASWNRINRELISRLVIKGILDARYEALSYDIYYDRGYIHHKSAQKAIGPENDCWEYGPFGNQALLLTFKSVLIKLPSEKCLKEINDRRKQWYLQDVVEEAKIRAFAFYNYRYGFAYPGLNIRAMPPEAVTQLELRLRKKIKLIKYEGREDFDFDKAF